MHSNNHDPILFPKAFGVNPVCQNMQYYKRTTAPCWSCQYRNIYQVQWLWHILLRIFTLLIWFRSFVWLLKDYHLLFYTTLWEENEKKKWQTCYYFDIWQWYVKGSWSQIYLKLFTNANIIKQNSSKWRFEKVWKKSRKILIFPFYLKNLTGKRLLNDTH